MDLCQTKKGKVRYILLYQTYNFFKIIFLWKYLSSKEVYCMKKIEAIIRPEKFDIVKEALQKKVMGGCLSLE